MTAAQTRWLNLSQLSGALCVQPSAHIIQQVRSIHMQIHNGSNAVRCSLALTHKLCALGSWASERKST